MKTTRKICKALSVIGVFSMLFTACSSNDDTDDVNNVDEDDVVVVDVDPTLFTTADGSVTISVVPCDLSDGSSTDCYQIVTSSIPTDHTVGPWCPDNIADDASAGGIWLEGGEVYDVDGAFVENMATFYNDDNWLMYDANGDIFVTATEDDCINAANPNVGEAYENFCVECLPSYVTDLTQTWLIPVTPVLQETGIAFLTAGGGGPGDGGGPGGGGPGGGEPEESDIPSTRGIALNGIEFSAPAPTDNILSAYTLAPFDDAGGHINVNQGYHYHAATGFSTKIAQTDGHAAMIGYALDGHGIFELLDEDGNMPEDLDEYRGHSDSVRGYHYHVDAAGNNNFINGLKGAYAE